MTRASICCGSAGVADEWTVFLDGTMWAVNGCGNLGSDFSARGGRQLGIYGRARRIRLSLQVHPHERFSNRYL